MKPLPLHSAHANLHQLAQQLERARQQRGKQLLREHERDRLVDERIERCELTLLALVEQLVARGLVERGPIDAARAAHQLELDQRATAAKQRRALRRKTRLPRPD